MHCVQFYSPAVGGMEEVVKQLSENLVRMGHDVTVATSLNSSRDAFDINGVKIKEFDISGNLSKGIKGNTDQYRNFLLNNSFDIITCFAAQQWSTDILLEDDFLFSLPGKKVFVPTGFSGLYEPLYSNYFIKMKSWLTRFDMNIFLSDDYRDINFAKDAGVVAYKIIPNGASKQEFSDILESKIFKKDAFKILHVGNHTGQKGHGDLFKLIHKIPQHNIHLKIIGKHKLLSRCFIKCKLKSIFHNIFFYLKKSNKRIDVQELTRSQVVTAYNEADLFLFPSNIECSPIVLFEAMASKTPFLTSTAGNSTEIIQWSKAGKILPSIKDKYGYTKIRLDEAISILSKTIDDKEELNKLATSGHHAWLTKFTWEAIAKSYEDTYRDITELGAQ